MKLKVILALFTLSVVVKGTWWAAAAQPVILSLGAMLAAVDLDLEPIEWRNLLIFKNKEDERPKKKLDDGLTLDDFMPKTAPT